MLIIQLDDFLDNGIIKENLFRKKIDNFDWEKYQNEKVLIKGCSQAAIPTWAYLIITYKLSECNSKIYFGEKCSAIKIS
mgnify:CR=1 FL=1